MTPIKRTCRFTIDKEKGKDDARLRYRIRWSGNASYFLIGYRVAISKWIPEAQRCKANTTHGTERVPASDINRRIELFEDTMNEVFYKFELADRMPSINEFRESFNLAIHGGGGNAHVQYFYEKFIEYSIDVKGLSKNRILSLKQTGGMLLKYKSRLRLNNLTKDELGEFLEYLYKNDYLNSTVQKHYANVRTFLIWAKDKGYYGADALDAKQRFSNVRDKEIIYLDLDEIKKLIDVKLDGNNKEIRDMFIFCCFTGLRYSDVVKLTKDDVSDNYIEFVTKKTKHHLKIDLNDHSKRILEEYANAQGPTIFYPYNISFANKRLKSVAKLAGLDSKISVSKITKNNVTLESVPKYEAISTHCGRRTFVVTALRAGISAEVIMKWTGHSSFESMKPYIAIVDELKSKEMNKFNKICF